MAAMKARFRSCIVITALVVALHLSGQAQGKPRLSAELDERVVPATQQELGVSKIYEVILVNNTGARQFVNQCEFTNDVRQKHRVIPVALQHWNKRANRWETISEYPADYCRSSVSLGARMMKKPIAPGQKLEADSDFVGAEDEFEFGDRGRFLVFLRAPGDYADIVVSSEFQIDEHRTKRLHPALKRDDPTILSVAQSEAGKSYDLKVAFIIPEVPNYTFDLITVYGARIVGDERSDNRDYLSLHGSWKPNDRVEFSVRVPKACTDPSTGWNLVFCVGSTASCVPSSNVLDFIAHKMDR
jgi:hypothetical protein